MSDLPDRDDPRYRWFDLDASVFGPEPEWAHHGLALASDGSLVGFDQHRGRLVFVHADGSSERSVRIPALSAHGITSARGRDQAGFWVADMGRSSRVEDGIVVERTGAGAVLRLDETGVLLDRLGRPGTPTYRREADYRPTSVAIDETEDGGGGDIWVADGYGQSVVHRYRQDGTYVGGLDGSDGAGRFSYPHNVFIDRRRDEPELLIADRSNHRIQVYDLAGRFKRAYGTTFLRSPSAFAVAGQILTIADLRSRLTLVDTEDRLVSHVADGSPAFEDLGWPNSIDAAGRVLPRRIAAGRLSSPHGLVVSGTGTVYVAEWRLGGRLTALVPDDEGWSDPERR